MHSAITFETQVDIQAKATVEGEAPSLPSVEILAYTGAAISLPKWGRPVVVDLAGIEASSRPIPIYREHDSNRIVGHGNARVEDGAVRMSGVLSGLDSEVEPVKALAAKGFPWQASIGFQPTKVEKVEKNQTASVNGAVVNGPAYVVRAGHLFEVSLVTQGADRNTAASIAASQSEGGDPMEIETSSEQPAKVEATASIESVFSDIRAKRERQEEIARAAQSALNRGGDLDTVEKLTKQAIEANWTPQEFELKLLREATRYGSGPAIHASRDQFHGTDRSQAIQASLAVSSGMPEDEAVDHFGERSVEASRKAYPHGMGIRRLLLMAARQNGYQGDEFYPTRESLRLAFQPVQASSGFSTLDIGGILSNVANKQIRAGFDAVESTWREVASIGSVRDFKETPSYSLTGDVSYEKLGAGGKIKHGELGETSYSNQADTYAKMLGITRQQIINDDLGALNAARTRLGRGAALKFNDVFWAEFLADASTFFTTARANYAEGATTALGIDSITAAELLFLNQNDPDGKPLGMAPSILLVPNALNTLASVLMSSAEVRDTTASTKYATQNPHTGKFRVVRSTYLSNSTLTGNSTRAWYLLSNPMDLSMIEVVFLNGVQTPTLDSADADFDTLGIQMRGYHDFGVNKQEYRAAVKMKGEA